MVVRRMTSKPWSDALTSGLRRLNARHPWSHNDHFHSWILANLPEPCNAVLDVGCGRGELLAVLAPHVGSVIGSDIDVTMRQEASRRCAGLPTVSVVDKPWTQLEGPFDAVTMLAVLHHLDLPEALRAVRRLLVTGGRFLAVGLAAPRSLRDYLWDATSVVTNPLIGYVKHPWPSRAGVQDPPFPVRDPTLSFDELRKAVIDGMPGATLRHHLAFRHTIAWTKP